MSLTQIPFLSKIMSTGVKSFSKVSLQRSYNTPIQIVSCNNNIVFFNSASNLSTTGYSKPITNDFLNPISFLKSNFINYCILFIFMKILFQN